MIALPAVGKFTSTFCPVLPTVYISAFTAVHVYELAEGSRVDVPKFWYMVPSHTLTGELVVMFATPVDGTTVKRTFSVSLQPLALRANVYTTLVINELLSISVSLMVLMPEFVAGLIPATAARDQLIVAPVVALTGT